MSKVRRVPHSAPQVGQEEVIAAERVLRSGQLAQGPEVAAFEEECADFVGRKHAVAVSSGTAALHLGLLALGMDESRAVAIPSYVCTALLNAVGYTGAAADIRDVGRDFNLDIGSNDSADAAIVTHLFGKPGHVPTGMPVIEDLAQALGGPCGRRGLLAVTSFYATKLMTSGGEGGMVLTDDPAVAEEVRDRRDYDNRDTYTRRFNYKMTDLAAAIGRVQLRKLPGWIARRREIADSYRIAFSDTPLELPDPADHVFFRYVVSTDQRNALETHLNAVGVEAKRPVFKPLHRYELNEANVSLADAYPGAECAHDQTLSIPLNPGMVPADISHVVDSVEKFF